MTKEKVQEIASQIAMEVTKRYIAQEGYGKDADYELTAKATKFYFQQYAEVINTMSETTSIEKVTAFEEDRLGVNKK